MKTDESFQILILKHLLQSSRFSSKVIPFLKSEYFDTPFREVYDCLDTYHVKYGKFPSLSALKIEMGATSEGVRILVESIFEPDTMSDFDWMLDTCEEWCRSRAIHIGVLRSIDIIEGNDDKFDSGAIPQIMEDALSVSFDTSVGMDYEMDAEARWLKYHEKEDKLPFKLSLLNKITRGGIPSKTLSLVLAATGVGKSVFMCDLAAHYMSIGKNVLYITLEMAEDKILQRIDANSMNMTMEQVEKMKRDDFCSRVRSISDSCKGRLVVKEYPPAYANVTHFKALLKDLRIKKGFSPDAIFIDYLSLMTSSRVKNVSANSYTIVKSIAEEVRGLAVETDTRVISAAQPNRQGMASTDMELEDVSESVGLAFTADLFLGISQTEEMKKAGIYKFKQLKNRYGDVNYYSTFTTGVDKARMTLYDLDETGGMETPSQNATEEKTETKTAWDYG